MVILDFYNSPSKSQTLRLKATFEIITTFRNLKVIYLTIVKNKFSLD